MKCKECRIPLKNSYYLIGGKELCKNCSLELISDISCYKIQIKGTNEHKTTEKRAFMSNSISKDII